jgi:hypothetical protein
VKSVAQIMFGLIGLKFLIKLGNGASDCFSSSLFLNLFFLLVVISIFSFLATLETLSLPAFKAKATLEIS